jgi:hypothetical protein
MDTRKLQRNAACPGLRALAAAMFAAITSAGCTPTSTGGGPVSSLTPITACANKKADSVNVTDAQGAPHPDLVVWLIEGLTTDPAAPDDAAKKEDPFDALLDCYVGPVDPRNLEQRLFRGHVIVTMLAMYGHYNLKAHHYNGDADDAGTILKSITAAELSLSRSSNLLFRAAGSAKDLPATPLKAYTRVDRAVDVLQVAIDVERPTYARARNAVLNLVAAIGGSPTAVSELLSEALVGIRKAAVLAVYAPALRADAFADLKRVQASGVTVADWAQWDRALFEACRSIAGLANVPNTCVPSASVLRDSFTVGIPSRQ